MTANKIYFLPGGRTFMMTDDLKQALTIISDDASSIEASFTFAGSLTIFRDHFPCLPVVPGVYLIALCRMVLETCGSRTTNNLQRAKFIKICSPDVRYSIRISLTSSLATCSIYSADSELCAKIILPITFTA